MKSGRHKEKLNTEFEMGGLREEIVGVVGGEWRTSAKDGIVETGGGDGSEMGSLMEEENILI